jgi:hypothetical protein
MKNLFFIPAAILLMTGCNQTQNAEPVVEAPTAAPSTAPAKLTATQELDKYCRVCVLDKNERMEEFLPTRLNTQKDGQTYKFCSEPCRKSFDANPKKYQIPKTKSG